MKTARSAIVITNCTGRKLHAGGVSVGALSASPVSLEALAESWRKALQETRTLHLAGELYAGRTFREAESVAHLLDAPLYIASAGMGLTSSMDLVPAYDLTVSGAGPSILPALRSLGARPAQWWAALNHTLAKPSPIAALLRRQSRAIVYVAMPSTYLALIGDELAALPSADRGRLRIFSSSAWRRVAPQELVEFALPYDERLEATEFAGTRNDFPQRALRHYAGALRGHELDLEQARAAVEAAMNRRGFRVLPERQKRTDGEICSLLRLHWRAHNGAGGRLLRVLRDELLIKCEQARFRDLWRSVRSEMERVSS